MKKTLLCLALATCIGTSAVAREPQSGPDVYAQFAIDHAPENVEELRSEPDFTSTFGTTFEAFGGKLTAEYAGEPEGGWRLANYIFQAGTIGSKASRSGSGAPDNPDPSPPGRPGNPGDTWTHEWSDGSWTYNAHYTYGFQNGVWGWHLDSLEAETNIFEELQK